MIETTNALEVFNKNIGRTDALIEAMDRIKAYNRLYQMSESVHAPEHKEVIANAQNEQLASVEQSCAEHAIISLATAFETYYKELIQELLAEYPDFFLAQKPGNTHQIRELIERTEKLSFEEIGERLKVKNRFDIYKFLESFSIPFLSPQERDFIEYIYAKRNSFVHSAGKLDKKAEAKFEGITQPVSEKLIRTEAKRLRTKLKKLINTCHEGVIDFLVHHEPKM